MEYNLSNGLPSRLNPTPSGDVFAVDDGRFRVCHLLDEALIRHNAAVEVNLCTS